jgi:hypothetical protein
MSGVLQWDLMVSLWRVADVESDDRVVHLQRAIEILRTLDANGRLYPEQTRSIAAFEAKLEEASSGRSRPNVISSEAPPQTNEPWFAAVHTKLDSFVKNLVSQGTLDSY